MATWKDIQKNSKRTGSTRAARKRKMTLFVRFSIAALMTTGLAAGVLGMRYWQESKSEKISLSSQIVSTKSFLEFETNGVLTANWARSYFAEFLKQDVRNLDLDSVKLHAEGFKQIKSAAIEIQLPHTLVVHLKERDPVLRTRVRNPDGKSEVLLIARDGAVYNGLNYPKETVKRLPGAMGLTLRKSGEQWLPVAGMPAVAEFLDEASQAVPSLYRQWRMVDLSQWTSEQNLNSDLIRVSTGESKQIIFSMNGFQKQLTRLAQIVNHSHRYRMGFPHKIDLSFGEEAVTNF